MADADDRPGADSPVLDAERGFHRRCPARISRLQRIAFGADASEAERHAAAAELEACSDAEADAGSGPRRARGRRRRPRGRAVAR